MECASVQSTIVNEYNPFEILKCEDYNSQSKGQRMDCNSNKMVRVYGTFQNNTHHHDSRIAAEHPRNNHYNLYKISYLSSPSCRSELLVARPVPGPVPPPMPMPDSRLSLSSGASIVHAEVAVS